MRGRVDARESGACGWVTAWQRVVREGVSVHEKKKRACDQRCIVESNLELLKWNSTFAARGWLDKCSLELPKKKGHKKGLEGLREGI